MEELAALGDIPISQVNSFFLEAVELNSQLCLGCKYPKAKDPKPQSVGLNNFEHNPNIEI